MYMEYIARLLLSGNLFLHYQVHNISLNTAAMKEQVYEFVKSIPRGKVATYGQIALHLGNRNFARAVGNILHGNPDPEHIPCHRVVNAQGKLSRSYAFGGIDAQRRLLESEGVVFKNDLVVDLSVSQMILE